MRAYNKKRKPKHHIKPRWKTVGGHSGYIKYSYQVGMDMKEPLWNCEFLGTIKIRYRLY